MDYEMNKESEMDDEVSFDFESSKPEKLLLMLFFT